MRRITLWIVSTIAAVVLLFSYRTSLGGSRPSPAVGAAAPGVVPPSPVPSGSARGSRSAADPPTGQAGTTVVNGIVAETRWGPVQVEVTITNGRLVEVRTLLRPSGNDRDDEINTYALPQLRAEALDAQSAHIDAVSGATVTSGGYVESLQAALDAAHFG